MFGRGKLDLLEARLLGAPFANDTQRQSLLPFVTRLACADIPEIERERAAYIGSRTARAFSFQERVEILEGALAIGRQAEAFVPDAVRARMDRVQGRATAPSSVADSPMFSKIKIWFGAKAQTEYAGRQHVGLRYQGSAPRGHGEQMCSMVG